MKSLAVDTKKFTSEMKTMKNTEFEDAFWEKINFNRKGILKEMSDNRDMNLFDFGFEKSKDYSKYYNWGNMGNTLKKLKIYQKNQERKSKKRKEIYRFSKDG